MRKATPSMLNRLAAVVVAVSLSVCCCQVTVLMHAFGAPGGNGTGIRHQTASARCGTSASADLSPCCRGPLDDQGPEMPDGAPGGCGCCCVKGTGLKGTTYHAAGQLAAILPPLLPVAEIIDLAPQAVPARIERCAAAPPAPTLLRLHCALIV
jgi:hypothetical protein